MFRATGTDLNSIAVSTTNGMKWTTVWTNDKLGTNEAELNLIDEVNGAYEVLVRVQLASYGKPEEACLKDIEFKTITMLNSKTQPQLRLGKNVVYIGSGNPSDSTVLWPDLQGDRYKPYVVEERNIATRKEHPGYQGVMFAAKANEPAHVVFRIDAPRDITQIRYGGRFSNRGRSRRSTCCIPSITERHGIRVIP